MRENLQNALIKCETDLEGALHRFADNEELYISCLKAFLEDRTISELDGALSKGSWDDAFTAAHALKGLAGNMGFVPLFHMAAEMVVLIRAGRTKELDASCVELKRCYMDVSLSIRDNLNEYREAERGNDII